jgi:hypothetical protein
MRCCGGGSSAAAEAEDSDVRDELFVVAGDLVCVLVGVEVKASATVTSADFHGLRRLKTIAGKRFTGGVVLYDGESSASFGEGLYAVPLRALWDPFDPRVRSP